MNTFRALVRAPSNIALVKYMGKLDTTRNLPANPSLSMTLSGLCTFVEVRAVPRAGAFFVSEAPAGALGEAPHLSPAGEAKFLRHFCRALEGAPATLRSAGLRSLGAAGGSGFELRSSNTFPTSAGIASSASSFAALTVAAFTARAADAAEFRSEYGRNRELRRSIANLSREGSGSSCRSFEGPFVGWDGECAVGVDSRLPPLSDLVVIISAEEKKVGSSEAHRRVRSSAQWDGRTDRAERRYRDLVAAVSRGDFSVFAAIAMAEFRDMHGLFETAEPPFSYFLDGTREVLAYLEAASGIAVTMDAGPNVHVIVPQADEAEWLEKLRARFPQFAVLADRQGAGAEIVGFEGGIVE